MSKNKVSRQSIVRKFITIIAGLLIFTILSLSGLLIQKLGKALKDEFGLRGRMLTATLANTSLGAILSYDYVLLKEVTQNAAGQQDVIYAVIFDKKGVIKGHSNPEKVGKKVEEELVQFITQFGIKDTSDVPTGNIPIQEIMYEGQAVYSMTLPLVKSSRVFGGVQLILSLERTNKLIQTTILWVVGVSLIVLLISIAVAMLFTRRLIGPILKLSSIALLTSETGDLRQTVSVGTRDEVGQLAQAFNDLIRKFHEIVFQIKESAEKVAVSSTSLFSNVEEMNANAIDISSSMEKVSKNTNIQKEKVSAASQIMRNISGYAKEVSGNAQSTVDVSDVSLKTAQSGKENSKEVILKMKSINEAIASSSGAVQSLVSRSTKISAILEILSTIAEQTNLLALNAAIEAARAGEAGRGFAVVAKEIRKLAENSASSAADIGKLIIEISNEIAHVSTAMETSMKEVKGGSVLIQHMEESLTKIAEVTQKTADMIKRILMVADTQEKNSKEAVQIVQEISAIAKENTDSANSTAYSLDEQAVVTKDMTHSTQELAIMADDLLKIVSRFKLKANVDQKKRR